MITKIGAYYQNNRISTNRGTFTTNANVIFKGKSMTEAISSLRNKVGNKIDHTDFDRAEEEFLTPRGLMLDELSTLRVRSIDKFKRCLEVVCYNEERDSSTPRTIVNGSSTDIIKHLRDENNLARRIENVMSDASDYLFEKRFSD